jgi:hypothetical protein
MSTPALNLTRVRPNWIATGFEGGFALLALGLVLLYLNPFWRATEAGLPDPRAHWWNVTGEAATALGLLMLSLALVGSVAALVSRCFRSRPFWPYFIAALAVIGIVTWVGFDGFTRDFDARFEWNSADGFKVFQLQGSEPNAAPSHPAANLVRRTIIGIQVQPQLRGYFKVIDWQRVNGHIGLTVVRIIPIAWLIALGAEGETLEDPDETPLMQAAEKGDLTAMQQLLAGKGDVNARDQKGQTALIYACRNPPASPALIKALLAAGADMNFRSRDSYTALAWATARGNNAVVQLLRRAGAKP